MEEIEKTRLVFGIFFTIIIVVFMLSAWDFVNIFFLQYISSEFWQVRLMGLFLIIGWVSTLYITLSLISYLCFPLSEEDKEIEKAEEEIRLKYRIKRKENNIKKNKKRIKKWKQKL